MKSLNRNKQTIYYAMATGTTTRYDTYGNETGSPLVTYGTPTALEAVLSPASGTDSLEPFGINENYSVVMTTDNSTCPIDETTIIWYGVTTSAPHNFEVVGVAKSLNSIKYALKKVSKS